jgi:hypothetical protein
MAIFRLFRKYSFILACGALLLPLGASAQWAAQPGETVRNGFGPQQGEHASMCRGACGLACPSACKERTTYECTDSERLLRVNTFICGTHQGCREHDDCLDVCAQNQEQGFDCEAYCHSEAVAAYGLQNATSWAAGGGPFDGPPILFEYTRDTPIGHDPAFRCPDGAKLQCNGNKGKCIAARGAGVDPLFDSYPTAGSGAMRISDFRSGRLCGDSVCEHATLIEVNGRDSCERGPCTRYGIEFDYVNADPSAPLECSSEAEGGGDFVGNMLKTAAESRPQMGDGTGEDGMAELMGMFQQVLKSADTPEDVQISMAPLDEHGNPIESQRVGTEWTGPPSVPRTVDIPLASGHLIVPMYQLVDTSSKPPTVRKIRCNHKGLPVVEVAFQLQY